ncbi:uncharacterized protein DS421_12g374910 [Arachis hypogaea]|nr:uncharacterized protein DS421_12g374910 [Arachis hypogaea]
MVHFPGRAAMHRPLLEGLLWTLMTRMEHQAGAPLELKRQVTVGLCTALQVLWLGTARLT